MSEPTEDEPAVSKDAVSKPAQSEADKALARKLRHRPKWKLFWIVSVISLVADQATKIWARAALETFSADPRRLNVSPDAQPSAQLVQRLVAEGHEWAIRFITPRYECVIPDDINTQVCGAVSHEVIGSFWHHRLSMNPGSAFGLFSGQGQAGRVLLSIVGILAVFGMVWMLKKARADQRVLHWALALVAGGAVGNLIDRIYYGVVTDFILWHWGGTPKGPLHQGQPIRFETEWPVFNIADVVLVVGVGLMFIDIQKEGKREKDKKKRRQEKARQAGLVKDL